MTSTASSLPNTGDSSGRLGGLFSAAALAGVALSAYSARRVALEREAIKKD